jgi:hypothetical protein
MIFIQGVAFETPSFVVLDKSLNQADSRVGMLFAI